MFVKFRIPRSALLCTLFILLQSPAWDSPVLARQQAASPDSIFINVNNPFTEKFSIRGLTSTFPYPILTTISVLDEQGKHISGLADTLDWIGPEATANNGRPVRDIWTPLLEFYQSDSTLPPNPDLYRQIRDPLFTEIREVLEVPTSTMLVMDMSESMQTVIDSVRDALEAFVASMRDVDRGAVLQFSDNNKIHIIRPFMSDRHRLQNGVNSGIPKGRTALYDALGTAIQATSRETSVRRAIIAYTDGVDNHSLLYTPESVIDSANVHRIPIFMIALGDSLNIEPLIRIAEGTGGIFFQAAGPREMPGIYRQLSVLIKNYYVMAHQSSDSLYNNTERVVSVQVNTSAGSVRGRGTYRVPGPDLSLSLTATADTSVLFAGDRLAAAAPGDTVGLLLHWQNSGEYAADSLTLELQPAWPIAAIDSTRRPVRADSLLRWRFAPLPVQGADSLFLSVIMPDTLAPDSLLQIFSAAITTRNEFPGANNFAHDSLVILQNESPPDTSATPGKTDLAITITSQTDTTALRDGLLRNAVFPGDTLSMQIRLSNLGPNAADSVRISRNLPQHLQFLGGDPVPEMIEKIQPDSSLVFKFTLRVQDSLAADITELVSTATLFAANDSLAANNSDSDTLFVLRKNILPPDTSATPGKTDLAITITSQTDTTALRDGILRNAVFPGDTLSMQIRLSNLGPNAADSVRISRNLPQHLQLLGSDPMPEMIEKLQPDSSVVFKFTLRVQDSLAADITELVSTAMLFAANDSLAANNSDSDTLFVLRKSTLPPDTSATPGKTDLAIFLSSQTDTTASRDGILRNAIFPGDTLSMQIELKNLGSNQADSVRISRNLPEHLQLIGSDPVPEMIEKIQPDSSLVFKFTLRVQDSLAADITELVSTATLFAANDSLAANNSDSDTLFVLRKSILPPDTTGGLVDLAIRQFVRTDSLSISGEDTTWFARAGEVVTFTLLVHNKSAVTAQEVLVEDFLPDSVFALGATSWTLPQLPGGESRIFTLQGRLAQNMPPGVSVLINRCRVHASNEDSTKLQDNRSEVRFFHLGAQPAPAQILAEPEIVNVGAPVRVSVRSESETRWWDVHVVRADGSIDSSYADAFINATPLPVGEWLELQPDFTDTRMVSELEIEPLTFELHTIDLLGRREVARTIIRIRSNNDFALERNVFRPGVEQTVDITFKLSSNREATLDLYDVAGRHVTRLSKAPYQAGWNTFTWNGRTESGQPVGSGIYVVTIRSGDYHSWKKLIVVR